MGLYPGYYGYGSGYYGGGYYPGDYASFYYPYSDAYPDAPYPPPYPPTLPAPGVPTQSGSAVNFTVQVPSNAEIWIEGQKTTQTGDVRLFQSPPLPPGTDYQYQIRARWTQGGTAMDQTRTVRVRAGDQFSMNFGRPAAPTPGTPASRAR